MNPPNATSPSAPTVRSAPDIPGVPDAAARRLSDKILAAFNHAYAVGELEVAELLRSALVAGEAKRDGVADQRRGPDPLCRADLWVAFVEARNDYRALRDVANGGTVDTDTALGAMKEAYRRWSQG